RDVPGELVALPHDQRHLTEVVAVAPPGDESVDGGLAGRRVEETGEHLEGGGLAGAVGTEEPADLAGGDLEAEPGDGDDLARLATEETGGGRLEPALAFGDLVDLAQVADADHRHRCGRLFGPDRSLGQSQRWGWVVHGANLRGLGSGGGAIVAHDLSTSVRFSDGVGNR